MSTVTYELIPDSLLRGRGASDGYSTALYTSRSSDGPPAAHYFLLFLPGGETPAPPRRLTLEQSWKEQLGCAVFTHAAVRGPRLRSLARTLHQELTWDQRSGAYPRFAWMPGVHDPVRQIHRLRVRWARDLRQQEVVDPPTLPIGRFALQLAAGTRMSLAGGSVRILPDLKLTCTGPEDHTSDANPRLVTLAAANPRLHLSGPRAGSIEAEVETDLDTLKEVGGAEFRSRAEIDSGGIRYPLFPGASSTRSFHIFWNVAAPLDPKRTCLAFDPDPQQPVTSYLRTPGGQPLSLIPAPHAEAPPPGLAFARSSPTVVKQSSDTPPQRFLEFEPARLDYYLTPSGPYQISRTSATAKEMQALEKQLRVEKAKAKPVHVMCGTSGSQYVLLLPGDRLCFVADHSRHGTEEQWTTAWAKVIPDEPSRGAVGASYCNQPGAVSFFDHIAGYARPAGAQLGDLTADGYHLDTVFPLFPYAGVYSTLKVGAGDAAINLDPLRQIQLHDSQHVTGEIFSAEAESRGPVFFKTADNTRLTGFVRTADGLLIDLHKGDMGTGETGPAGTLKRIYLAKGPKHPAKARGGAGHKAVAATGDYARPEFFTLNPGARAMIDPALSSALLTRSDLVIVTDKEKVPPDAKDFGNEITLGDFPFQLEVGPKKAILLFKFASGKSLEQLLQEARTRRPAHFLGAETLPQVLERIDLAIEAAKASQKADTASSEPVTGTKQKGGKAPHHKPAFGHFLKLIADPDWAGFLVLGCPLDYNNLPADVATLLGGIRSKTRLPAHHVGVTINRPRPGDAIDPIQSSSLFAVIYYENEWIKRKEAQGATYEQASEAWKKEELEPRIAALKPLTRTDFETLRLEVLFENSKQQLFTTRLALTNPELFSGVVKLDQAPPIDSKPADTMVIDGHQIRHPDGTSSLVFEWPEDRVFVYQKDQGKMSALQNVTFRDLRLRPIRASPSPDGKTLTAISIFEHECDLDFFDKRSSGVASPLGDLFSYKALRLDAYGLLTTVTIPQKGEPTRAMVEDLSGARVDEGASTARHQSLIDMLPLHPSNVHGVENWKTASAGGWWVKGVVTPGTLEPLPQGAGYAVEFDFPMGTTGGQQKKPAHVTARLLLAWAAGGPSLDDEHGVWFGLRSDNMNLQGIMRTSIEDVRITRDKDQRYALVLEGYQVHVFGHSLPAQRSSMVLKPKKDNPRGKLSWLLVPYDKALEPYGSDADSTGSERARFAPMLRAQAASDSGPFSAKLLAHFPVYIGHGDLPSQPDAVTQPNFIGGVIDTLLGRPLMPLLQDPAKAMPDPGDKLIIAAHATLATLDFKFLMHDNDFYGGRIEVRADPTRVDGSATANLGRFLLGDPELPAKAWGGGPAMQKVWDKLDGAALEVYYKHLKNGVGVVSANLVLPKSIANRKVRKSDRIRLTKIDGEIDKSANKSLKELKTQRKKADKLRDEVKAHEPRAKKLRQHIKDSRKTLKTLRKESAKLKKKIEIYTKKSGEGSVKDRAEAREAREKWQTKQAALDAKQKEYKTQKQQHHRYKSQRKKAAKQAGDIHAQQVKVGEALAVLKGAFLLKMDGLDKEKAALKNALEVHLGNISLAIFVGQDVRFRVALGWPISANPFELILPPKEGGKVVPFFKAGLYFAYLSPEDLPDTFGAKGVPHYGNVFAAGIALGYGKKVHWEKGPLKFDASYEIDASLQLYYAVARSKKSGGTGEHYLWLCAQVSLTGAAGGSVDLVIINLSFSLKVVLSATFACETKHTTTIDFTLDIEAKASVKIAFITIHVKFHKKMKMLGSPWHFGHGPDALAKGPSPQKVKWPPPHNTAALARSAASVAEVAYEDGVVLDVEPGQAAVAGSLAAVLAAAADGRPAIADRPRRVAHRAARGAARQAEAADSWANELEALARHHRRRAHGDGAPTVTIPLHFTLQTTAVAAGTGPWSPRAIASLLIDIGLPGDQPESQAPSDFSRLCASLVAFLAVNYAPDNAGVRHLLGWDKPPSERERRWVEKWLGDLHFEIAGLDPNKNQSEQRVVLFPMLPPLELRYGLKGKKRTVALGDRPDTVHVLQDYFEFMARSLFETVEEITEQVDKWSRQEPGPAPEKGATPLGRLAAAKRRLSTAKQTLAKLLAKKAPPAQIKTARATVTAATGAVKNAQTVADSLAGKIQQAEADWARNPSDAARNRVIDLRIEAAARKSLFQLAGNLSRYLLAGTCMEVSPRKFKGLYEQTGQQFDLIGSVFELGPTSIGPVASAAADAAAPGSPGYATTGILSGMNYEGVIAGALAWDPAKWTFHQLPPLTPRPMRYPLAHRLQWSDGKTQKVITPFSDDLRHALEIRAGHAPWLIVNDTKQTPGKPHASLDDAKTRWNAEPALLLPVSLHRAFKVVNDTDEDTGEIGGSKKVPLDNVVELVGTDEAHRALLGVLLRDLDKKRTDEGYAAIREVHVLSRKGSAGGFTARGDGGMILVKTNLSTATGGATAGAAASHTAPPYFAKAPADWPAFLRLVLEASVVHAGGFFLKFDKEKLGDLFGSDNEIKVKLLVTTSEPWYTGSLEIREFHNAAVGLEPDGHLSATLATGIKDVEYEYVPTHPFGQVGVEIIDKAPDPPPPDKEWNAAPTGPGKRQRQAAYVRHLYQVFSCQTDGQKGWSHPIHGVDRTTESGDAVNERHYVYQPGLHAGDDEDRYKLVNYDQVGKSVGATLRVADIYGNVPPTASWPRKRVPMKMKLVYNDPVLGVGQWLGVRSTYQVTLSESKTPQLQLDLTFNEAILEQRSGDGAPSEENRTQNTDPLTELHKKYTHIQAQLADVNLQAWVETTLSAEQLGKTGSAVKSDLLKFVTALLEWFHKRAGAVPSCSVKLPLTKNYPAQWTWSDPSTRKPIPAGDLRELTVDLVMQRCKLPKGATAAAKKAAKQEEDKWFTLAAGDAIGGQRDVRKLMPGVQHAKTPIHADQHENKAKPKESPQMSLLLFAKDFEAAYADFGGPGSRLKVATGINSNPRSVHFGHATLWVMRWGGAGVSLERGDGDPLFSAPVPVNQHLITRLVTGLGVDKEKKVFSSIDLDRWAAEFLSSVEDLFDPTVAPGIANIKPPAGQDHAEYDRLAASKAELAATIKRTLDWVYQGDYQGSNPRQARQLDDALSQAEETMLQALLTSLENDYGTATVAQVPLTVSQHDSIEPWEPKLPAPNLFGPISARDSKADMKTPPYSFSNAKLPLTKRPGKSGKSDEWLNFLVHAKNPADQSYFELDLDYPVSSVEHDIRPKKAYAGYVPSSWLSFVLPEDAHEKGTPKTRNTLTTDLDARFKGRPTKTVIPVPLRSFPPNPKLIRQTSTQSYRKPKTIEQALEWDYEIEVAPPRAAQDSLVLQVVFNEEVGSPETETVHTEGTHLSKARLDFFEALARYRFEAGPLQAQGTAARIGQIDRLNLLIGKVRDAWKPVAKEQAEQRQSRGKKVARGGTARAASPDSRHETWELEANWDNAKRIMRLTKHDGGEWPTIDGYKRAKRKGDAEGPTQPGVRHYTWAPAKAGPGIDLAQTRPVMKIAWRNLYVLQYQSAHAGASVRRNEFLRPENAWKKSTSKPTAADWKTNPAFVYQTELVRFSSPVVPLISAEDVETDRQSSLQGTIQLMLDTFRKQGSPNRADVLRLESQINHSFELLGQDKETIRPSLPLFLLQATIGRNDGKPTGGEADEKIYTDDGKAAANIHRMIELWHGENAAEVPGSELDFAWTLFATKIVKGDLLLPLVRIRQIKVRTQAWWSAR